MKNILFIAALVISLGLIGFLYQRLSATQEELKEAQKHFADCQQVTFQLQNQLSADERNAEAQGTTAPSIRK
jgi:archaellum component FlaG (FlaF/FlaG flagellin family)